MRRAGFTLAVIALMTTLATLDDPGLTVDEPINVGHGKTMVTALREDPASVFRGPVVYTVFQAGHEHPPLARFLLGVNHALFDAANHDRTSIAPKAGRAMSAVAYAWIVYLATGFAWRLAGPVAGWSAGIALLLMPRMFGHAHLASPEVISAAFFLAALAAVSWSMEEENAPRVWRILLAGIVLGLAFLTKLTVVLLPLAVIWAMLLRLRHRGVLPLVLWLLTGVCVFFLGWPWLWPFDFPESPAGLVGSLTRARQFAAVGVNRATIYVWYFGQRYPYSTPEGVTVRVPWHFVWVFFAVTVPVGLQALGILGLPRAIQLARSQVRARLLLATLATILVFFSLPVERYDGERIFLMLFPLWGIVIGIGASTLFDFLARHTSPRMALGVLAVLLGCQSYGILHGHPFELSYYNALVGGVRGADRLGLEATYWGDSVTESLLDEFANQAGQGQCAILLPTLYPGHAAYLSSAAMRTKGLTIHPGDQWPTKRCGWAIVFNRKGYTQDSVTQEVLARGQLVAERSLDGVWLSRVYRLDGLELGKP